MKRNINTGKSLVDKYSIPVCAFASFCFAKGLYFASAAATEVGQNLEKTSKHLLNEVASVYCNSIAWLLIAILLLAWFFSKNEKVIAFAQRGLIGAVVAFIVLKILNSSDANVISNTTDTLTNWMQGS